MMDYLIATCLLLLIVAHGLLLYGCYDLRLNKDDLRSEWRSHSGIITGILEEIVEVIDDLGGGGASGAPAIAGGGVQDFLTQMLMSRVAEAAFGQDGEEKQERTVPAREVEVEVTE